jgi:hypothetical protein
LSIARGARSTLQATIWRVLTDVDAAPVDAAIGAWLADRAPASSGTEPLSLTPPRPSSPPTRCTQRATARYLHDPRAEFVLCVKENQPGVVRLPERAEDDSTVRSRSGPRIMAALSNLAIGELRLAGRADITEATRWPAGADRPFTILGLAT